MRDAVALWVRADWRHRRRALFALALLAGLAGAVVLTAVAGARRTSTSFERLADETKSADLVADVGAVDPAIVDQITRLPLIDTFGAFTIVFAVVDGVERDLAIWAPRDSRMGVEIERDRILRGRSPDPASVTEVTINETTADIVGVDVGDQVSIATLTSEQVANEEYYPARGPRLQLEVVGVVRGPDDLGPRIEGGFIASPAFLGSVRGRVDEWTTYLGVELVEGATVAELETAMAALIPPEQEYETLSFDVRSKAARGTITAVGWGLVIFAIVAAVASLVAVGQAIGRHVASARLDEETLGELGVTRTGRRLGLVLLALPAAIGGAAFAAVAAWLASPTMPIGLARRAEPDPGLSADWLVLGPGALAILLVVLASAAIAALWVTPARRAAGVQAGPSVLAAAATRAGAGPVAASGMRLALDRRAPALPVRSAIAGGAMAILGLVAVLTFSTSLDRVLAAPERWGYGWDLLLDFTSTDVDAAAERLVDDERLIGIGLWDAGFSHVEGEGVRAFGLRPVDGDVGYALRSGRQPLTAAEVVLGPETAERLGAGLGDIVHVGPEPKDPDPATVIVVGTALFPDDGAGSFGDAIGYFGPAFAEHAIAPDLFEANQLVVRVAPGLDVEAVAAGLNEDYPESASSGENVPTPPGEVANLAGVRSLPRWLAAFVAILGIASLGHVLLTTLWRRRVELATLRSLGLTPGQTVRCLVWQAVTITGFGLAIGIPLGVAAGDAAWFAVADPIGVATDASRPLLAFASAGVAALVVAVLVAIVPGWRASRLRPAQSLRAE